MVNGHGEIASVNIDRIGTVRTVTGLGSNHLLNRFQRKIYNIAITAQHHIVIIILYTG